MGHLVLRVLACIANEHDYRLVLLAALICAATSFTTFHAYSYATHEQGSRRMAWVFLTGMCAGAGIWATHFIAMLAYAPGFAIAYDLTITILSLVVAIIVVTARGEEPERVLALDAGADDYLVKPFGLAELLARIRAVLRRVRPGGELLKHGALMVDLRTRRVTVSGQEVALTPKEFDILECLAADPGRVLSRQEILESAWDAHWYGPTKVLDVHVGALRRKLGVPGLIETVYGRGFRLGGA